MLYMTPMTVDCNNSDKKHETNVEACPYCELEYYHERIDRLTLELRKSKKEKSNDKRTMP